MNNPVNRWQELADAFLNETEIWLDNMDFRLLYGYEREPLLGPGERISSETGEIRYSASDETKQALKALETDIQVLEEMLKDVVSVSRSILGTLHGQIAEEVGVKVFEDEEPIEESSAPLRASPFKRRPVHEQYSWIKGTVLSDGRWHNAFQVARSIAGDEREFRYLRGAISGRMRELYDAGELERQDCQVRGAMYEYRLKR